MTAVTNSQHLHDKQRKQKWANWLRHLPLPFQITWPTALGSLRRHARNNQTSRLAQRLHPPPSLTSITAQSNGPAELLFRAVVVQPLHTTAQKEGSIEQCSVEPSVAPLSNGRAMRNCSMARLLLRSGNARRGYCSVRCSRPSWEEKTHALHNCLLLLLSQ